MDVGTSGGVWGLERGYCMMIGGETDGGQAPRSDLRHAGSRRRATSRARRAARRLGGTAEQGYLHCGPNGAGHFVKMVHNGIEYGLMAAYAEGLGILRAANIGKQQHEIDAETTPLRDPEHYQYDLNLRDIAEVWRRGSVIASWLLDLTAAALVEDPALSKFAGRVSDSGEGRWTIKAAIDEAVPVPVLTTALYERFSSRGEADFQDKLLSAMRYEFGGHLEKPRQVRGGRPWTDPHSDALVFFGATGDLAYKKIFPSLQAMVKRGHLNVPVIGVAKAGWNLDQLQGAGARQPREARRTSIPRPSTSCAACCATSTATTRTPRPFRPSARSSAPRSGRRTTWPSRPRCSGWSWSSWPKSGCTGGARVIVEKPFGRDLASAQELNRILLGTFDEAVDLPHRPLPGQAAGAQHALLPLRQRVPGAVLEPQPRRERADHHGGELRRPGPRRLLR